MKNGKLKLEKGISIPEYGRRSELMTTMESMKVGDSFLYPLGKRTGLPTMANRAKIKIVTRTVDAEHVRVWRVE